MLLVEVRWSKIAVVSLDTHGESRLYILLIFVQNACDQLRHKQTLDRHTRCMQLSEQLSETAVWKWKIQLIVNHNIWFMQEIYCEWLTPTVLWTNDSNLYLMQNKKMVSLLYKILHVCYRSVSHFISVLEIVHRSPGNHDNVIDIRFFIMPISLTKIESCSTW